MKYDKAGIFYCDNTVTKRFIIKLNINYSMSYKLCHYLAEMIHRKNVLRHAVFHPESGFRPPKGGIGLV